MLAALLTAAAIQKLFRRDLYLNGRIEDTGKFSAKKKKKKLVIQPLAFAHDVKEENTELRNFTPHLTRMIIL